MRRRVNIPELSLRRYGQLAPGVFYFLSTAGQLERLDDARRSSISPQHKGDAYD